LDAGHKKQQHKTELVGWFVGCFSNHTLRNYATRFGQLAISHIKQQVVHPCNHTTKHGSKVKTKRPSFAPSFAVHFERRFEPLDWCVLFICAAGRKKTPRRHQRRFQ